MSSSVSVILTKYTNIPPIGRNKFKPIETNKTKPQSNVIVDRLLQDYAYLIDPEYKSWFAKKFYNIPFELIHRFASESRNEGKYPKRLFAYKVGHYDSKV